MQKLYIITYIRLKAVEWDILEPIFEVITKK
jgi:hypothetical protein